MTLGNVAIRINLRPGDIGRIVLLHGTLYAAENGFDETFEAYVAGPLADFVLRQSATKLPSLPGRGQGRVERERIWLAEAGERLVGGIAIVTASASEAQLRWFVVHSDARGIGLGRKLLAEAIAFCREQKYESIFLWTVSELAAAARLYESVGFRKVESIPALRWGRQVVDEKYTLRLA